MQGWISLHRKILDNPILSNSRVYSRMEAFIFLLLRVNHSNRNVPIGVVLYEVKKGQMITSQMKLCKQFKWGNTKLRNFLKLLETDGMIEVKTETNLTRITILNYCSYQDSQINTKLKTKQKKIDTKLNTNINNNVDNFNNVNNVHIRKQKFTNQVLAEGLKHTAMVAPNICDDFIDYWTEMNKSKTKMKFELQNTFDIGLRLKRWIRNDFNKNVSHKTKWKYDATQKFYLGYCSKCGKSNSYDPFNINKQDSKCCNEKLSPKREVIEIQDVNAKA